MAIQFNPLLDSFGLSENIFHNSLGKLKGYSVRVINFAHHVLQNEKIAVPTVIAVNVVASFIIFKVIKLNLKKIFSKEWRDNNSKTVMAGYLSSSFGVITLLHLGFYKGLKPCLSPMAYTAFAVTTTLAVLFYRMGNK